MCGMKDNQCVNPADINFSAAAQNDQAIAMEPANLKISDVMEPANLGISDVDFNQCVRQLLRRRTKQFVYSLLRNLMCHVTLACLVAIVVIMTSNPDTNHSFLHDEKIVLVVLGCLGVAGIPLQIIHAINEVKGQRLSITAGMLRNATNLEMFQSKVSYSVTSAPLLAAEVRLKKGVRLQGKGQGHWTVTSNTTKLEISYSSWSNLSKPFEDLMESSGDKFCIIIGKDYGAKTEITRASVRAAVAEFCDASAFNLYPYYMVFEMLFSNEGEDYFPVLGYHCVYKGNKPFLYEFTLYKLFLFTALDSVFQCLLYWKCKYLGVYKIVKVIEK